MLDFEHSCCMGSLHQDAAWDCYPAGVCDQGQGHCY